MLLGACVAQSFASQAAQALELPTLSFLFSIVWTAIVAYSWVGPAVFQRMLCRELEGVRLRSDF